MKKLGWAVLLLVGATYTGHASARDRSARADTLTVSRVGPPNCQIEGAIPGHPVCAHAFADAGPWPQCCQVCIAGSFVLLGDQNYCSAREE